MSFELQADQAAIAEYGTRHTTMAAEVAAAGAGKGAMLAAAIPVFGLIGQEFLASFGRATSNHLTTVAEIAAAHAGTAVTAYQAAGVYTEADGQSGREFDGIR